MLEISTELPVPKEEDVGGKQEYYAHYYTQSICGTVWTPTHLINATMTFNYIFVTFKNATRYGIKTSTPTSVFTCPEVTSNSFETHLVTPQTVRSKTKWYFGPRNGRQGQINNQNSLTLKQMLQLDLNCIARHYKFQWLQNGMYEHV